MAVAELANISERRVEQLVNPALSSGLTPFLAPDGGLHSDFMIAQVASASLVRTRSCVIRPASTRIPSSAGREEITSAWGASARRSSASSSRTPPRRSQSSSWWRAQASTSVARTDRAGACVRRTARCASTSPSWSRTSPLYKERGVGATRARDRRARSRGGGCGGHARLRAGLTW